METNVLHDIQSELDAAKRVYEDALEKIKNSGSGNLFKAFFDAHPEAHALQWAQYTPYFNDGDPCVFSVGDVCVALKSLEDNEADFMYGYPSDYEEDYVEDIDKVGRTWYDDYAMRDMNWTTKEYTLKDKFVAAGGSEQLYQDFQAVCKFIGSQDDLMEALFGDHVVVRVTPTEIITEEYEHD